MANVEPCGTRQDLLYRRARALADYENSNKALDKARLKSKDIPQAEEHQKHCLQKFDKLSESGKRGLYIHLCVSLDLLSVSPLESTAQSCVAFFFFFFFTGQCFLRRADCFQSQTCGGLQEEPDRDGWARDKACKGRTTELTLFEMVSVSRGHIMITQLSFLCYCVTANVCNYLVSAWVQTSQGALGLSTNYSVDLRPLCYLL